jgi:hypothetical protein
MLVYTILKTQATRQSNIANEHARTDPCGGRNERINQVCGKDVCLSKAM